MQNPIALVEYPVERHLVVQREARAGIEERALVDHDLAVAHAEEGIVGRLMRTGDLAFGHQIERDLMRRLLAAFAMGGKAPRSVIVMTIEELYFQCARAIVRSDLWNPDKRVDPKTLPTPGEILAGMSDNQVGGEKYDMEWPERARQTMW